MHWLYRILTAIVLFFILFVVAYFGICVVGGAISGGMAGAATQNTQDSFEAGRQAGENFVKNNIFVILGGSFLIASVGSAALSFTPLFPWCRAPKAPPRM